MTKPRKTLVSLDSTPYYHCISRCVRRAFLCGEDQLSGRSYEHRRDWIEERLLELTHWFSIDICAYAVMSNHTHLVLHVDSEQARAWSLREVVEHWHGLFAGTQLSQLYLAGNPISPAQLQQLETQVEVWRERLVSVSWFMRCLNEYVARLANAEDDCTGRFWEGRFKCQALLDTAALVACMAYVDLNPVRAGIADTIEEADHTAVRRRIRAMKASTKSHKDQTFPAKESKQPPELMPFTGNSGKAMSNALAFQLDDYIGLLEWSSRCIREDKYSTAPGCLPPLLEYLQIKPAAWLSLATRFEKDFRCLVGQPHQVQMACDQLGRCWAQGVNACRRLFST